MSDSEDPPLTSAGIARQLIHLSRQLDELVAEVEKVELESVNTREDYTCAHSQAFVAAEGAMELRKHTAVLETHEQRLAAELAETHVKGLKRRIETVKLRIELGRSLGAAVRAEAGLAGNGSFP